MDFAIVQIEFLSEEDWLRSGVFLRLSIVLRQLVLVYASVGERSIV